MDREPVGTSGEGGLRKAARGLLNPRRRFVLAVAIPIVVSIFSQFEFVQNSRCIVARLPWGVGQCEVMADLIAPAWALSIIPVAGRLRKLAHAYGSPPDDPTGWLAGKLATGTTVRRATSLAKVGAVLIVVLAYTREWERFNEQPEAVWYALLIIATFVLLLIPLWWVRHEIHARGVEYLTSGRLPRRIDGFLFSEDGAPPRWPHVLAFSGVTLIIGVTVLAQLDALVTGMHLPADPPAGIGALPSIFDFDLSEKRDLVLERVRTWRSYDNATGAEFGSPYSLGVAHVLVEIVASIPAYFVGVLTLAFFAWRHRRKLDDAALRRGYEFVILAALAILVTTVVFDVLRNVFTWYVLDRAWYAPGRLTNANVRLLWFFALGRTLGIALLILAGVLLLALTPRVTARIRPALIAVRSEVMLLIVFAGLVLFLPQTADVIRGWRVSHTAITVGLVVLLSMLVRWTSSANLRLQEEHRLQRASGSEPQPRLVSIPFSGGATTSLKRFVAGSIVALAIVQLLVSVTTPLSVGRGLLIPGLLTLVLALVGLGLPAAEYVRGDRPVPASVRRRLPRLIGALLYVIVGIAVLKAAASEIGYARHEDWYLFFALVPPAVGIRRIVTRTTHTMGGLEAAFAFVLVVMGASLLWAGNPELSPSALIFTGVTFSYGSLAYYNSYRPTSLVSRFSKRYLRPSQARPFVIAALAGLGVAVVSFLVNPITVGPQIGTIGMVILAMMVLTIAGAGAVRFAELTSPPRIFSSFGIRRTPVVILLIVWMVLAPAVAERSTNDVRISRVGVTARAADGADFEDVWRRWSDLNLQDEPGVGANGERRVVPLLLVSSSGGGLRAATWTSFVLDCLFERAAVASDPCGGERDTALPLRRVAVMSAVSGGALGVATYVTHVVDGVESAAGANDWVDEVLGEDYLAAPVGWLFLSDLPRTLLGFGAGIGNRSEVMERAWEESWPEGVPGLSRGITELWESRPDIPALLFNGTSVNDACRFNVSAIDAHGSSPDVPGCSGARADRLEIGHLAATYDLTDFLCDGEDVPLSTAAGLVARFPVVSASGRIAPAEESECPGRLDHAVYVVDGGYLEGSGSGTLLDAWEALSEQVEAHNASSRSNCVVPFMVHIDNGYESSSVSGEAAVPREFLVPFLATLQASSGITAARAEAALVFEQPFTIAGTEVRIVHSESRLELARGRYARLVTRAHPGVQAPLGWTLSQASINDLRDQLAIPDNALAFAEIRSWMDDTMLCEG